LIGGLNNSGKTALLEAIQLSDNPHQLELRPLEQDNKQWAESFFYDKNKPFIIDSTYLYLDMNNEPASHNYNVTYQYSEMKDDNDNLIVGLLSEKDKNGKYPLKWYMLETLTYEDEYFSTTYKNKPNKDNKNVSIIGTLSNKDKERTVLFDKHISKIIPSFKSYSCEETWNSSDRWIDKLMITFDYLDKEVTKPIKYLGEGIVSLVELLIECNSTINSKGWYLLIVDNIGSKVHYTQYALIWEIIYDTLEHIPQLQVFATTHSLEMIQSFTKCSMKYEDEAMYFKMNKQPLKNRTRVIASNFEVDLLEHNLIPVNLTPNQPFR
jgi:predicted ATP-dependent endonuclease of OLD family